VALQKEDGHFKNHTFSWHCGHGFSLHDTVYYGTVYMAQYIHGILFVHLGNKCELRMWSQTCLNINLLFIRGSKLSIVNMLAASRM
jgi:hypothetical protein